LVTSKLRSSKTAGLAKALHVDPFNKDMIAMDKTAIKDYQHFLKAKRDFL